MITRRFLPLEGESIAALAPASNGEAFDSWRRRMRLFPGRALTASALRQEQAVRAGALTTAGQLMSAGVVDGLQVSFSVENNLAMIEIGNGLALTRAGETVSVPTAIRIAFRDIPGTAVPPSNQLGILLLEPVEMRLPGEAEPGDQCDYDPAADAFMDWQLLDGCQLRFIPWPVAELGQMPTGTQQRNNAARQIFDAERKFGPTQGFSWEEMGVSLALVATSANGLITFADRYSVVRDGGRPRRRTDLIAGTGHPSSWQARVLQFCEHAEQLNLPPGVAAQQFAVLPPAGILPAQWFSLSFSPLLGGMLMQQSFFPPNIELTARVVPLDQLDALLEPSAPLQSIQMSGWNQVEILLPVPQVHFEPTLLEAETVDSAFANSMRDALTRRADWLGRRALVRDSINTANRSLTGKNREFPLSDPNRVDVAEDVNPSPPATDQGQPVDLNPVDLKKLQDAASADLEKALLRVVKDVNTARIHTKQFTEMGLIPAAERLEALADRGDDIVNTGFLRAQADMYRLRQLLVSGTSMTRLSISPALVGIAEATTTGAREEAINKVIAEMKGNKLAPGTARSIRSVRAVTGADTQINIQDLDRLMAVADGFGMDEDHPNVMTAAGTVGARVSVAASSSASVAARVVREESLFSLGRIQDRIEVLPRGSQPPARQPDPPRVAPIEPAEPVVGRQDIRATGTFARLSLAKGPEARDFALSTKYAIVNSLKNPVDTETPPDQLKLSAVFGGVLIPGLGVRANNDWVFEQVAGAKANLRRQNQLLSVLDNGAIARILDEPDDANLSDEAGHFSAAVDLVEHAIAALRGAEFFIEATRSAAAVCRGHAAKVVEAIARYEERLAAVEDEVAEARQDVSFINSLLAEERQRVALINARRARVLAEQVPFVAFRRPLSAATLRAVTVRTLDPAPTVPAVPACLARDLDPPEELQRFVELLRESPVRWFPRIALLLERIDRRPLFDQLILTGQARHAGRAAMIYREAEFLQVNKGRFEGSLVSLMTAQRNRTLLYRDAILLPQLADFAGLPWSEAHRIVKDVVSIGDVLEGTRPAIARAAANELESISRLAACLTAKFAETPPEIRLDWALRFSQFDDSITLRNLSVLPRWQSIDFLDRHEMQSFTDWMYAQVDANIPEAVETIGNIVQAAMLLASHAPVNRLLQGAIDEVRDVEEGHAATAKFDLSLVPYLRRGLLMHIVQQDTVVAHAVIDDIQEARAQIRVVKNLTANRIVKLGLETRVVSPRPARAENQLLQGGLSRTDAVVSAVVKGRG